MKGKKNQYPEHKRHFILNDRSLPFYVENQPLMIPAREPDYSDYTWEELK